VTAASNTREQAREVLFESIETGRSPAAIVGEHGFAQVSDERSLEVELQAVIAGNPRAVEDYRGGKRQAIGALMADLTKRAPQANRKVAIQLLERLLG